jgi:peptidoglycan/LPS O-acetylase OafA/YrhL
MHPSHPAPDTPPLHPRYRPDIDGLRAIAILAVVVFHAFPQWLPGGFVGVDIFFVISGFLISSIIFGNLERGSFSYADFYARRVRRIFPALIVVLASCYAAGWFLLLPDEYKQLGKHIAGGTGFVSNLVLWNEAGYFDRASEAKPLLHLWSLGIEEQFYIFWPLLLGAVWKYRLNFLATTLVIAAASFLLNVLNVVSHPVASFYSPLARFWELMVGGLAAYLLLHRSQYLPRHAEWPSLLGLLLIALALVCIDQSKSFPGGWALLPTAGAFLLISAQPASWVNRQLLGNRVMVWIGLISYPLYLWHWPLLAFLRIQESGQPSALARTGAVLAAFILAALTYWLLEKPIRQRSRARWIVAILCLALALVGAVGFKTYQRDGLSFRLMRISPELMGIKPDIGSEWRREQCFLEGADRFADSCVEDTRPTLFLWGDSHAAALYPGLKQMQSEYSFGIVQRTASACRPLLGKSFPGSRSCRELNDDTLRLVARLKPEYVLLHANWTDLGDLPALEATITAIRTAGAGRIVLIGPDPTWNDELPRILFAYHRKEHRRPPLRMTENDAQAAHAIDVAMREFAQAHSVHYLSSLNLLCDATGCLTRTAETAQDIMTMDGSHLTPQGARYQASHFLPEIFATQP